LNVVADTLSRPADPPPLEPFQQHPQRSSPPPTAVLARRAMGRPG
jgi:hypothetical protein